MSCRCFGRQMQKNFQSIRFNRPIGDLRDRDHARILHGCLKTLAASKALASQWTRYRTSREDPVLLAAGMPLIICKKKPDGRWSRWLAA